MYNKYQDHIMEGDLINIRKLLLIILFTSFAGNIFAKKVEVIEHEEVVSRILNDKVFLNSPLVRYHNNRETYDLTKYAKIEKPGGKTKVKYELIREAPIRLFEPSTYFKNEIVTFSNTVQLDSNEDKVKSFLRQSSESNFKVTYRRNYTLMVLSSFLLIEVTALVAVIAKGFKKL